MSISGRVKLPKEQACYRIEDTRCLHCRIIRAMPNRKVPGSTPKYLIPLIED